MIYPNNKYITIVDNFYYQHLKKEKKLSFKKNNYIQIYQTNYLLFAPLEM